MSIKGTLMSIDALLSGIMLFCFALGCINFFYSDYFSTNNYLMQTELEAQAISFADILINTSDQNNYLNGIALQDNSRKRIQNNVINENLILNKTNDSLNEKFFVKKINLTCANKILFESKNNSKNCVAVNRFILDNNQKCILEALICKKDSTFHLN